MASGQRAGEGSGGGSMVPGGHRPARVEGAASSGARGGGGEYFECRTCSRRGETSPPASSAVVSSVEQPEMLDLNSPPVEEAGEGDQEFEVVEPEPPVVLPVLSPFSCLFVPAAIHWWRIHRVTDSLLLKLSDSNSFLLLTYTKYLAFSTQIVSCGGGGAVTPSTPSRAGRSTIRWGCPAPCSS
ncbi:hypothetical protein E2562_007733 [Oryza meyeriana var. granulata]|uniref:Uncharacterized protein n=1 Tax=Oryza meyeriana var. granulata TaxID=110450 RepID=A0A6G1EGS3_9ORYZ|nr:hypothetical protein E2562_007733 [Oryza meyeriana var. granulata]